MTFSKLASALAAPTRVQLSASDDLRTGAPVCRSNCDAIESNAGARGAYYENHHEKPVESNRE
jgi:hypothetical protein